MIINPDEFEGWEEDHWKNTTPGNWREFIAVNGDLMLWLNNTSENSWGIKVGTGTDLRSSTHLTRTQFESRNEALLAAADFMEKYPTVTYRKNDFPALVDGEGNSISWSY